MSQYVYLLRCGNGSLYAGITNDPARRFRQHSGELAGGSRAVRMLRPLGFAAVWRAECRSAALSLEARIKRLTHGQKEALAAGEEVPGLDLTAFRPVPLSPDRKEILMEFICYSRCSTCKKAKAWLDAVGVACRVRDVKEDPPTEEELREWQRRSGLPLKRFFNTSGRQYRALGLSEKLPAMSEDEQFALLASDGMLVKRPIAVAGDTVLVGFREAEWETLKGKA